MNVYKLNLSTIPFLQENTRPKGYLNNEQIHRSLRADDEIRSPKEQTEHSLFYPLFGI